MWRLKGENVMTNPTDFMRYMRVYWKIMLLRVWTIFSKSFPLAWKWYVSQSLEMGRDDEQALCKGMFFLKNMQSFKKKFFILEDK